MALDYLSDKNASKYVLCQRIMDYYHSKGKKDVKAWVEAHETASGREIYVVRSNLKFGVPK